MDFASLDFVNSEQWDGFGERTDHLLNPAWIEQFLAQWKLAPITPDTDAIARLTELRGVLRRVIEDLAAHRQPHDADLAILNELLESATAYRTLVRAGDEYSVALIRAVPAVDWLLAELAASAIDLLNPRIRRRIKVCANHKCRWAFYDKSRGNTRRWCNDRTCGNRDKVQRFRKRREQIADESASGAAEQR